MALWKPFRGSREDLATVEKHDGYVYFCDDGALFFDYADSEGVIHRKQINADTLTGYLESTQVIHGESLLSSIIETCINQEELDVHEKYIVTKIEDSSDFEQIHMTLFELTDDEIDTICNISGVNE